MGESFVFMTGMLISTCPLSAISYKGPGEPPTEATPHGLVYSYTHIHKRHGQRRVSETNTMFKLSRCIGLPALLPALLLSFLPAISMAQFGASISVNLAPPELPVYEQPPIPGDGYLWVPGYWYWSDDAQDYYWVPGTWVEAPQPGLLWTPGYWGSNGGAFVWNAGYWGPQVGFYGGVNYGFGYGGRGYEGGYWQGGHLFYNTAVVNVGTTHVTNVYVKNVVVNNVTVNRVSYNGGNGGVQARATPAEEAAARAPHVASTPAQQHHVETARSNPALLAKANQGHPPIAATAKPGELSGKGVVAARGAPAHPAEPAHPAPAEHAAAARPAPAAQEAAHPAPARPAPAVHPTPRPAVPQPERPAAEERRAPAEAAHPAAPPARPAAPARPESPRPQEHQEHPEHPEPRG
jgi:hypothetical protein